MNKKVDEEFVGIKDVYALRCIATEMKVRIVKAIDYIEHKANIKEYFMVNGKEYTELLDILKGSNTNVKD